MGRVSPRLRSLISWRKDRKRESCRQPAEVVVTKRLPDGLLDLTYLERAAIYAFLIGDKEGLKEISSMNALEEDVSHALDSVDLDTVDGSVRVIADNHLIKLLMDSERSTEAREFCLQVVSIIGDLSKFAQMLQTEKAPALSWGLPWRYIPYARELRPPGQYRVERPDGVVDAELAEAAEVTIDHSLARLFLRLGPPPEPTALTRGIGSGGGGGVTR
ncbi:hypothetical protein [Kitasatospora sp. NPDC088779]|uniref:hypothetical protein n=1 Tax=Kitasatospora sp. NPDC088779 TaxID=3154964 RepID=UPI0034167E46